MGGAKKKARKANTETNERFWVARFRVFSTALQCSLNFFWNFVSPTVKSRIEKNEEVFLGLASRREKRFYIFLIAILNGCVMEYFIDIIHVRLKQNVICNEVIIDGWIKLKVALIC